MSTQPFYLMENPNESARLEEKNNEDEVRRQLEISGLKSGMKALDVGCGSGVVARLMARIAGPNRVTGLDMSATRLEQARALAQKAELAVDFVAGEATNFGLASASFDYSWSRFLFEYLPEPQKALREMIQVTRPGGIVAVADLDGQLETFFPLDETTQADLADALRVLSQTGFDPRVGRKLFHWFLAAGLENVRVDVAPYQVYAGALSERDLGNWREKLATGTRQLSALTGQTERWRRFHDTVLQHLQSRDIFYYSTLITVWGTVPLSDSLSDARF